MKLRFLSMGLLMAIVLTACAQQKKTGDKAKMTDYSYIKMERTNCFGTCPNYFIEIYKDGLVRYTGRRFAKPDGTYEKNVGAETAGKILKEAAGYRVDTCKDAYDMLITDVPGIHIDVQYGSEEKHIRNANFGPDFLKRIALEMDASFKPAEDNTTGWKKTAEYKAD